MHIAEETSAQLPDFIPTVDFTGGATHTWRAVEVKWAPWRENWPKFKTKETQASFGWMLIDSSLKTPETETYSSTTK